MKMEPLRRGSTCKTLVVLNPGGPQLARARQGDGRLQAWPWPGCWWCATGSDGSGGLERPD